MKFGDALNDYLTAYDLSKEDTAVALSIACMYARLGDIDEAVEWHTLSGVGKCEECNSIREVLNHCLEEHEYQNTKMTENVR